MRGKKIDMIGLVYGKLTVLEKHDYQSGHIRFLCECECGNEIVARGSDLRYGKIKSCGCRSGSRKDGAIEEFPPKTDCYAYLKRQGREVCTALTEVFCRKEECKFYKSLKDVCLGCEGNCERCLTVSYQKQQEK